MHRCVRFGAAFVAALQALEATLFEIALTESECSLAELALVNSVLPGNCELVTDIRQADQPPVAPSLGSPSWRIVRTSKNWEQEREVSWIPETARRESAALWEDDLTMAGGHGGFRQQSGRDPSSVFRLSTSSVIGFPF